MNGEVKKIFDYFKLAAKKPNIIISINSYLNRKSTSDLIRFYELNLEFENYSLMLVYNINKMLNTLKIAINKNFSDNFPQRIVELETKESKKNAPILDWLLEIDKKHNTKSIIEQKERERITCELKLLEEALEK